MGPVHNIDPAGQAVHVLAVVDAK